MTIDRAELHQLHEVMQSAAWENWMEKFVEYDADNFEYVGFSPNNREITRISAAGAHRFALEFTKDATTWKLTNENVELLHRKIPDGDGDDD